LRPRIVLILVTFPKLSESFIVNKFIGLISRGWDVRIVATESLLQEWGKFPQLNRIKGAIRKVSKARQVSPRWVPVIMYPFAILKCVYLNPLGLLRYFFHGFIKHGWKILRRFYIDSQVIALKPDLIHFEFGATASDRADLNFLLGCKEVVSFRGYDLNYSGLDRSDFYDEVWKYADGYHFISEDLHQQALKRGCPVIKTYSLIPPAINTDYFNPGKKECDIRGAEFVRPLHILSVGRLELVKGYEYALQAIRNLVDSGVECEYHIIGAGSSLESLLFARQQLDLEKTITFLGEQSSDHVKEELEWADVFLNASVSEGFCNAILEAQSMCVPVVCTDAGGLPENVEDGVTSLVVSRHNAQSLSQAMAQLAYDGRLRVRMGEAGRARVLKNFQIPEQISQFEKLYLELLEGKPFHD
jgi:colanic acid/amylovoran biosynthesis glycosyltransferase